MTALLAAGTALAAQSSPNALTGGGGRSAAGTAAVDATVGDVGGVAATDHGGPLVLKVGFIGQLREVTGVAVTADPGTIASRSTTQLSGVALLDDDTFLVLAGRDIAWSAPAWPLDFITADGVASAAVVDTFVAAPFTGAYLGVVGEGSVLVVAPPSVVTLPAGEVISLGSTYRAQLDGLVNPRGFLTTAWFEWGARTSAVQFATTPLVITGTNDVPLRAQLENLSVEAAHEFRMVASNSVTGVVWGEHRLFGAPPFIVEQPDEPQWPVEAWTPFTFAVQATGTGRLQYQWRKEGLALTNAVEPSLVFPQAQVENSGVYSVGITNDWGAITSRVVQLTVRRALSAPGLVNEPTDQAVVAGGTLLLSVEVFGDQPLAFQWRRNTVNLSDGPNDDPLGRPLLTNGVVSGATTPYLTITNFQPADAGTYSLVVQNSFGAAESHPARVRLAGAAKLALADGDPAASQLLTEPAGVRVARTDGFQTRDGVPCLAGAQATMGWLSWRFAVTGVATFTTAGSGYDTGLAVYDHLPGPDSEPVGCDDDSAGYLTSYQSFRTRAGATYWLAIAGAREAQGDVVVAWSSEEVALPPPVIISQPQSVVTEAGVPREFLTVLTNLASGDVLQWRRDGANLPDSTTVPPDPQGEFISRLSFPNVGATDVGVYTLQILRSGLVSVESAPVVLEIREGLASEDITSEYKQEVLAQRVLESRDSGLRAAGHLMGPGQSVSAGTIMSDNFRPAAQGGTPQTLVIGGSARWYDLRVTTNGLLTVETSESTFDPVLQVYANVDTNRLTGELWASDDNGAPDGTNAWVQFVAQTNKIYLAVVDGHEGASGPFTLKWTLSPGPQGDNFRWLELDPSAKVPPGYVIVDASQAKIGKVHLVDYDPDRPPVPIFSNGVSEAPPTYIWFPIATNVVHLVLAEPVAGVTAGEMQSSWKKQLPWEFLPSRPEVSWEGKAIRVQWHHPRLKLQTATGVRGSWLDDIPEREAAQNEIRFLPDPDDTIRLFRVVPDVRP